MLNGTATPVANVSSPGDARAEQVGVGLMSASRLGGELLHRWRSARVPEISLGESVAGGAAGVRGVNVRRAVRWTATHWPLGLPGWDALGVSPENTLRFQVPQFTTTSLQVFMHGIC
jgi:hypothetical protein